MTPPRRIGAVPIPRPWESEADVRRLQGLDLHGMDARQLERERRRPRGGPRHRQRRRPRRIHVLPLGRPQAFDGGAVPPSAPIPCQAAPSVASCPIERRRQGLGSQHRATFPTVEEVIRDWAHLHAHDEGDELDLHIVTKAESLSGDVADNIAMLERALAEAQGGNGNGSKSGAAADVGEPGAKNMPLVLEAAHAAVLAGSWRDLYRWSQHEGTWRRWTGRVWRKASEAVVVNAARECCAHTTPASWQSGSERGGQAPATTCTGDVPVRERARRAGLPQRRARIPHGV